MFLGRKVIEFGVLIIKVVILEYDNLRKFGVVNVKEVFVVISCER